VTIQCLLRSALGDNTKTKQNKKTPGVNEPPCCRSGGCSIELNKKNCSWFFINYLLYSTQSHYRKDNLPRH